VRATAVLGVLALLVPAAVAAQVTGNVALLSDYRFRGESLTEDRPALQAGVNYDNSSGLFVGGLVSNVRIEPDVAGLGGQLYGGYTRPIDDRSAWDIGVVTYVFPSPTTGPAYNYTEAFVGVTFETVSSRLYYTNSYFGGGRAVYLELNATRSIADRVTLVGHLGYLDLSQPREPVASGQRTGLVDFLAGVNIDISGGFTLGLSIVGTDAQQSACPAGSGRCNTTVVVSVSHSF